MKPVRTAGLIILVLLCGAPFFFKWKQDAPRRIALGVLADFNRSLASHDASRLLNSVVLPQSIRNRTPTEQAEFLRKALENEVSSEGIATLNRKAQFGPLNDVFPSEGMRWATQAGVDESACVAFKMERNGIRAEVVLARDGSSYRVVRCNNVKQMATVLKHG